jgi:hypothetical protein
MKIIKLAQHFQESHHSTGSTEEATEVVQVEGTGNIMSVSEKFHIYKETYTNSQLNDKATLGYTKIFATVIHQNCSS